MAHVERRFTAEHVVAAPPWDVFEMLTDDAQQGQWRQRFQPHSPVLEEAAYTRVLFEDLLLVELAPEGAGTQLTVTRTKTGEGLTGRIGLWFTSRRTAEEELLAMLKRIGATVEFGAI